ncbi:MAG: RES family NAD+ phosphorylase [Candidatus Cyclonatronum sp.]|uniref:RES family NAD+ phosphorylase n=1 Tax=Cyclonatronum sp. TaxID=3024185 RepID=UPI0025BD7D5B|nr:RES family NAD+ phosphorylase [Cyclonatronum sp.]MCH8488284.1 RES family NAD+ phosphorylase [Cyclonatronum sp.]
MLPESELRNKLAVCPLGRFQGRLWREIHTEHILDANPRPLYAEGPVKSGARFTPKGGFRTLYLSFDRLTASLEIQASFRKYDGSLIDLADRPTTILPVDADLDSVLDFTNADTLDLLNTNISELTGEWRYAQLTSEAVTQILGRAAFESGRIKAMKYRSAKDPRHGLCLAVFIDRLVKGHDQISCIDKSKKLSVLIP